MKKIVGIALCASLSLCLLMGLCAPAVRVFAGEQAVYGWDFEDSSSQVWKAKNSGYSVEYKDGVMSVNTGAEPKSGTPYVNHDNLSLDSSAYRYLLIRAKSTGSADNIKFYFKNDRTNVWSEILTVNIPITPNATSFSDYYVDLAALTAKDNVQNQDGIVAIAAGEKIWVGNYINCMLSLGYNKGVVEIDEIAFTDTKEGTDGDTYYYDLSAGVTRFGSHTVAYEDNHLNITVDNSGGTQGAFYLPAPSRTLSTGAYGFVTIKAKNADGFRVYFKTDGMSGYDALASAEAVQSSVRDGEYSYYVVGFENNEKWTGKIAAFMIRAFADGTSISEIFVSGTDVIGGLSGETGGAIKKITLSATDDAITTESGTVTLTCAVEVSDETVDPSVYYVTDSINAVMTRNTDGSVTLTGRMNGTVTVTAVSRYDSSYRASKVITITNQSEKIGAVSYKLMAFGNSILAHGYNESIGWPYTWGMAASAEEKDYIHRLIRFLEEKYGAGSISYQKGGNVADFERKIIGSGLAGVTPEMLANAAAYDYSALIANYVKSVRNYQPDIITVQIGENVNTSPTAEAYAHAIDQLVDAFHEAAPDALIVLCTSFWGGSNKVEGALKAAEQNGLPIALLHTLNTEENMAIGLFEHSGVARHPGDTGMNNIAKLLYEQINRELSLRNDVVYTELVASVSITAGKTEITTAGGTLQLGALVLPVNAAQGVLWSIDQSNLASIDEAGLLTAKNDGTVVVRAVSKFDSEKYDEITITISGQTKPFTVTYDKNTTAEVRNMPPPNPFAKGDFVFDAVYPERDAYRFLGWALTPDGTPADSIPVSSDVTVYAIWRLADAWSFDRDGDTEGFRNSNIFHETVEGGMLSGFATGTDVAAGNVLRITSPVLALDARDYNRLSVTMKNSVLGTDTTLEMTVTTTTGVHTFTKAVTSGDFVTYVFDLAELTGTITGFSFTPTNVDCAVYIDEIAFGYVQAGTTAKPGSDSSSTSDALWALAAAGLAAAAGAALAFRKTRRRPFGI